MFQIYFNAVLFCCPIGNRIKIHILPYARICTNVRILSATEHL